MTFSLQITIFGMIDTSNMSIKQILGVAAVTGVLTAPLITVAVNSALRGANSSIEAADDNLYSTDNVVWLPLAEYGWGVVALATLPVWGPSHLLFRAGRFIYGLQHKKRV